MPVVVIVRGELFEDPVFDRADLIVAPSAVRRPAFWGRAVLHHPTEDPSLVRLEGVAVVYGSDEVGVALRACGAPDPVLVVVRPFEIETAGPVVELPPRALVPFHPEDDEPGRRAVVFTWDGRSLLVESLYGPRGPEPKKEPEPKKPRRGAR
jgi:hypothetical protein